MTRRIDRELHGDHMVHFEARVDLHQLEKAAAHQSRADDQHHRDRDFGDDEPEPQAMMRGTGHRAAGVL